MTPAIWAAEATQAFRKATGERSSADATSHERRRYEAIVRAVLMALRELDDDTLDAMADAGIAGAQQSINSRLLAMARTGKGQLGLAPCSWLMPAHEAMIDHILDTKARRAAALQDLADIDRDLL